jgi:hypothetical protein
VAFLNWRFGLTRMTAWRIEVAPFPDLSNVATPQNLSSPSQSLYMDMGMVMMGDEMLGLLVTPSIEPFDHQHPQDHLKAGVE